MKLQPASALSYSVHCFLQVGWICQALGCYGLPFAPSIYFTKNGMGKVFFWIFAMFPWNPLTKGVLDMSAAAADATRGGGAWLGLGDFNSSLQEHDIVLVSCFSML